MVVLGSGEGNPLHSEHIPQYLFIFFYKHIICDSLKLSKKLNCSDSKREEIETIKLIQNKQKSRTVDMVKTMHSSKLKIMVF